MPTKEYALKRLDEISHYSQNWNKYGADPFDQDLIDKCKQIIDNLFICPMVFPTANDSIQIEYKNGEKYIEIEVFSDKYCLFCRVNEKCADIELDKMSQVIDWWNILTAMA